MNDDQTERENIRLLWTAVVRQAFFDALHPVQVRVPELRSTTDGYHRWSTRQLEKIRAHRWLTTPSEGLTQVCEYAGVDPDWVRRIYREMKSGKRPVPFVYNQAKGSGRKFRLAASD